MWQCDPEPEARRVYERGSPSESRGRGEPMNLDVIVSLCKRRGFIFQSSEIYGGIASCWDYGPLGVELKNNVKRVWWRDNVYLRPDMVGLDAAILMHPRVWKASGHLDHFTDPMVDCKACQRRFRADQLDATPWIHYCPATKGNKFEIPGGEPCKHCGARRTRSGTSAGSRSASPGTSATAFAARTSDSGSTRRKSSPTMPSARPTSSTSSRWDGVSSRASPTVPTSTSSSTVRRAANRSPT